jgi:hypothetical protein
MIRLCRRAISYFSPIKKQADAPFDRLLIFLSERNCDSRSLQVVIGKWTKFVKALGGKNG